jgi:hypothetical protein
MRIRELKPLLYAYFYLLKEIVIQKRELMLIEDLEEYLTDILFSDFKIKKVKGKLVIYTNLIEDKSGELIEAEKEVEEEEEDLITEDELDLLDS